MAIVMSWSKCLVEIGVTPSNEAMAETLTSVGKTKDKSSTLTSEEGETLEMKASGGETVGYEKGEGIFVFTTRVIEPADSLYATLGLGTADSSDSSVSVTTHVVNSEFSLKVTPNKIGARGIEAPKCSVSAAPGWSEEDGHYIDLTFGVLHGSANYWYKKFTKKN